MSVTPEQIVATSKASFEAGLKSSVAVFDSLFGAVESLSALNLETARSSFDDAVAYAKAVSATTEPKALVELQSSLMSPAAEKSVAYVQSVSAIGIKVKDELGALCEAEAASFVAQVNSALDTFLKSAPAGSESAVSALKSVIAQANAAYEGATKAAKEAAANVQASVDNATAAALGNITKASKPTSRKKTA